MKQSFILIAMAVSATSNLARGVDTQPANVVVQPGHIAAASVERLENALADLKIPPELKLTDEVEEELSAVGLGNVDRSKPIGLFLIPAAKADEAGVMVEAMPLAAKSTLMASLKASGIAALDKEGSVYPLADHYSRLKVTPGYALKDESLSGPFPTVRGEDLGVHFRDKDILISCVSDNLESVVGFGAFLLPLFSAMNDSSVLQLETDFDPGFYLLSEAFPEPVMRNEMHGGLEVRLTKERLGISATIGSPGMNKGSEFFVPVFSSDAMITAHMCFTDAKSSKGISGATSALQRLFSNDGQQRKSISEPNHPQPFSAMVADAIPTADAVSAALTERADGQTRVTIFAQYKNDVDVIGKVGASLAAVMKDKEKSVGVTVESYTGGDGAKGLRIGGEDAGKKVIFVLTQTKRSVTITLSNDVPATVEAIHLSMTKKISKPLSVRMNLEAMTTHVKRHDSRWGTLSPAVQGELVTACAGKYMTLDVGAIDAAGEELNVSVPVELVRMLWVR